MDGFFNFCAGVDLFDENDVTAQALVVVVCIVFFAALLVSQTVGEGKLARLRSELHERDAVAQQRELVRAGIAEDVR